MLLYEKKIPRERVTDRFVNILCLHTGRYWSYTFKTVGTISDVDIGDVKGGVCLKKKN